jgi:hypothetical protein
MEVLGVNPESTNIVERSADLSLIHILMSTLDVVVTCSQIQDDVVQFFLIKCSRISSHI